MSNTHSHRPVFSTQAAASFIRLPLRFLKGGAVVSVVFSALSCATVSIPASSRVVTDEQRSLNVESFEAAWKTIHQRHWDLDFNGLDWLAVHDEVRPRVEAAETYEAYLAIMQEMIGRFDQSHFAIVPNDVYAEMTASIGRGAGEGAAAGDEREDGEETDEPAGDGTTGIDLRVVEGKALVTKVDEGSPAAGLGVKTGWEIVSVEDSKVARLLDAPRQVFQDRTMLAMMLQRRVSGAMGGAVGDTRRIRFRNGRNRKVELEIPLVKVKGNPSQLGNFPVPPVWLESKSLENGIGYIAFNGFMDPPRLMPAFEQAVKSFRDARGIIIDIRDNGGGLPIMAMGMAGWLTEGEGHYFGTIHSRDGDLRLVVNPRSNPYGGPVAVLIDGSSASCAEIFPAGLRDMGRARLFGTRTAGAVLPAQWMELPNGDFFYYPVADYFSKNGARLEGIGVAPDVDTPYDRASLLAGKDNAIEAAIAWIQQESGD